MAETYAAWRIREQAENPDPERCGHGVPLRRRCTACELQTVMQDTGAGLRDPDSTFDPYA